MQCAMMEATATHSVRIFIEVAPLEEDGEYQPAKDAQHKEHLRNELQRNVDVMLEVPTKLIRLAVLRQVLCFLTHG